MTTSRASGIVLVLVLVLVVVIGIRFWNLRNLCNLRIDSGIRFVAPFCACPGDFRGSWRETEFGRGRGDLFSINGFIYQVTILDFALTLDEALRISA